MEYFSMFSIQNSISFVINVVLVRSFRAIANFVLDVGIYLLSACQILNLCFIEGIAVVWDMLSMVTLGFMYYLLCLVQNVPDLSCWLLTVVDEHVLSVFQHIFNSAMIPSWNMTCYIIDCLHYYSHEYIPIIITVMILYKTHLKYKMMDYLPGRKVHRVDCERTHTMRARQNYETACIKPECIICMERTRSVVLLPCGHVIVCLECAQLIYRLDNHLCPLCRRSFEKICAVYV